MAGLFGQSFRETFATEDEAAERYRQSLPIVEAAGIAELGELSGADAVRKVAAALEDGDSNDPRRTVFDAVEG